LEKQEMLFQPAWLWSSGTIVQAALPLPGLSLAGLFSSFYTGLFSSMKNLSADIKNLSREIAASGAFYMSKV
jgi:hypothetical protein